jgi:hypothetical protein
MKPETSLGYVGVDQLVHRNVVGPLEMPLVPLLLASNVDDRDIVGPLGGEILERGQPEMTR